MIEHENSMHTRGWIGCEECAQERIRQHLEDPETIASLMRGMEDTRAGRVLPWRVAMWPLPRWAFSVLYAIAPFTWGRSTRRLFKTADPTSQKQEEQ